MKRNSASISDDVTNNKAIVIDDSEYLPSHSNVIICIKNDVSDLYYWHKYYRLDIEDKFDNVVNRFGNLCSILSMYHVITGNVLINLQHIIYLDEDIKCKKIFVNEYRIHNNVLQDVLQYIKNFLSDLKYYETAWRF